MSEHTQPPTGTTGPPTTFHLFPNLPWELRHAIWELAVRPLDRPGAHIFCLEERDGFKFEVKQCDVICKLIDSKLQLSVPAKTMSAELDSNPSMYMVDGGLWTACKESRAVMEKTFKHRMWDLRRRDWRQWHEASLQLMFKGTPLPAGLENPYEGLGDDELDMIPATGCFLAEGSYPWSSMASSTPASFRAADVNPLAQIDQVGIRNWFNQQMFKIWPHLAAEVERQKMLARTSPKHYFSVFPNRDLFIIRPSSWNFPRWGPPASDLPFFKFTREYCGSGSRHSLAVEYDPTWTGKSRKEFRAILHTIAQLVLRFGYRNESETVWIIDYRLKYKPTTPAHVREPSSDQKVFHLGDGRRYVEVYSEYEADGGGGHLSWFETEGIEGDNSSTSPGSCHSFIGQVEANIRLHLTKQNEGDWDPENRWEHPTIGLLACLD